LDVADIAVDGMEIAVASVEIEARELGRRSGGSLVAWAAAGTVEAVRKTAMRATRRAARR